MPKSSTDLRQIPLTTLTGVGPALQKKLAKIGICNTEDLLFHLPLRYEDRTRIHKIGQARIGSTVQLEGEVLDSKIQFGRRRSLQVLLRDSSGVISLRFYHFSNAQKTALEPGVRLRCYGEVRRGRAGFEIYHPEYRILAQGKEEPVAEQLTAVYPATEGIQQGRLRNLIRQALDLLDSGSVHDLLPAEVTQKFALHRLDEAIKLIHQPPVDAPLAWINEGMNPGQKRLAFEELLAHRLCMRRLKMETARQSAPGFETSSLLAQQFLEQLPFELTPAQQKVYKEIAEDMSQSAPMLRLLQGDVGSGKTVVAALAALHGIAAGYQVAIMAPTEILAEQHLLTFSQWFDRLDIRVGWLSGKVKGKARSQILHEIATGESRLIVGTHALFQEDVEFSNLGLIIIDEQHRFGVHQRLALREKAGDKQNPHQLVMTATPIPRTLAMSAYADLDNSIIDELPPGRTPVNTAIVSSDRRQQVIDRISSACDDHRQVYWVCTLIEESEALQAQAAESTANELTRLLPEISIGLVHGRMKAQEKQQIMRRFKEGELQLLVATTVIEVGVDVPNASLMVIENPERLGLAQLHQLRGRVGRGAIESHCILLYQVPLSDAAKQRLQVMRESNDGFYIAEKDLELRGPGQVLGTQQTGLMTFRVADIVRDSAMLDEVKQAAEQVFATHPDLIDPLVQRWLGERVAYAQV